MITIVYIFYGLLQIKTLVLAEQSGSSPESGVTSRIKTIYDSLVSLTHGSDSAGGWGDWGAVWNRIRSAAEWVPDAGLSPSEVVSGETFYSGNRTAQTGIAAPAFDYSTQSKVTWDDNKNSGSSDGDSAGEESAWTNTAGTATTGVWKDTRTGLYWSASQGNATNSFTVASCDYFSTSPRGSYAGGDSDCGNAINTCANLSLDATGDGNAETDWYLPSQKELMQAYLDGIYNQTNTTFVSTSYFHTSTEYNSVSSAIWVIRVREGTQYDDSKSTSYPIRCVRRE